MTGIFRRALGYIYTVFRSCDYSTSSSHLNPARSGKKSHEALRMSSNCHVWRNRWIIMFQDFIRCIPWDWMFMLLLLILRVSKQSLRAALAEVSAELARLAERCLGARFWKRGGCIGFLIVEWSNSYSRNYFLSHRISIKWSQTHGFIFGEWL